MLQLPSTRHGWGRGLLLGWLAWTIYAAFYAGVLYLSENVPYKYTLPTSLISHYLMAIYSIPVWFWTARVLARGNGLVQLLGHIAGAFVFAIIWYASFCQVFIWAFGEETFSFAQMERTKYWQLLSTMTMYGVVVGIFYILRHQRQLREKEQKEAELRLRTNQIELAVLKAQLNPHFLFNTLNSINALVSSDPEAARLVLAQLAEVLRYSLESDRLPLVPLSEELRFVETYLAIEQARFGKRLQVKVDVDDSARPLLVPPMILQPLAENAVKHGLAPKEAGGELLLNVRRRHDHLEIEVADNGVGCNGMPSDNLMNNGRGLHNTDLRLRKMFGDDSGLQVSNGKEGFRVKFKIPVSSN
jgi:hypothetical protein